MFDSVRRHQRILLGVVLLLIIPSFVVVGAWDLISPGGKAGTVAKVGKREISFQQWERSHQQALEQIRSQLGGRIDPAILDSSASRLSTLNDLVTQQVLFAAAVDLNVRITDEQMRRAIASIPAVQKNGQFDMSLYQQALKAQGLTADVFEQRVRADMLTEILPATIGSSAMAPRSVARRLAQLSLETRSVRIKKYSASDFAASVKVSDADIEEFYKANAAQFQTPEELDIAIVAFAKPGSPDMVEQFSNLVYEQSDTRDPAAKKVGLPVHTVRNVRRTGPTVIAPPEVLRALSDQKFMAALFSSDTIVNRRNTEAVEIAPGLLASARVVAHRPSAPIALATVKAQIERTLRDRKSAEQATQAAEAAVKEFASSKALPAGIAAARSMVRTDLQKQGGELPADVVQAIFAAELKTLPATVSVPASSRNNAAWVVVVESSQVPSVDSPAVKEQLGRYFQILEQTSARDTLDRWVEFQRQSIGVKTYPEKISKADAR
jgi:hypothetical protein